MKKPDLRKLDLEDLPPPESTFMQGVLMGSAITAISTVGLVGPSSGYAF